MIGFMEVCQSVNIAVWSVWGGIRTDPDVVANKMRVEFAFYNTLRQLEFNTDLFQFRSQEFC